MASGRCYPWLEPACREVLDRLRRLNHHRDTEVASYVLIKEVIKP